MYNYREAITQSRKKVKGPLPVDYHIKSYNDLVQSILFSLIQQDEPYNWIACEGMSEKIYFEQIFSEEISKNNLRILPLGSYKEVKKLYVSLSSPIKDPDYTISGKVLCLIDTDEERVDIPYEKDKNLLFKRLINTKKKGTELVDVNSNIVNPPTEIEDCLNPVIYFQTLLEFGIEYPDLMKILTENDLILEAKNSAESLDLRDSERTTIKEFFDDKEGFNKIRFAKTYVKLSQQKFFENEINPNWIDEIKAFIK